MRVLHVITGLNDGGAESVLYRLVSHDGADVHHVVSLTGAGKYASLLRKAGAFVSCLEMQRGRVSLQGLRYLWRSVSSFQPDVMQTWMYHANLIGGLVAPLAGVPLVWGIHHADLDREKESRVTILTAEVCAFLSRWLPQRIVACAQSAATVHSAIGYDGEKMVVIHNGVDLSCFYPDSTARERLRKEWGQEDGKPLIGMVARFNPVKDHATLLNAFAILRRQGVPFHAVLVGMGMDAQNEEIMEIIESMGLSECIELIGSRSDIPAVMNALDLHVLSSYSESFGNVLAESMACGTPCVTTNVGDGVLVVGDNGWIVPPRDSHALANALARALHEWHELPDVWRDRQVHARESILNRFGLDAMVAKYRSVWMSTIQGVTEC